jgi:capsular polysaccharide biosynthesis protein
MRPPVDVPRGRDYLRMLRNGWLVILCATVLSTGAALLAHQLRDPVYVASAQVFAVVPGDAGVRAAYEGDRGATTRIYNYTQLAKSDLVTRRTINDLDLNTTSSELAGDISVASVPDDLSMLGRPMSALMKIEVTGQDADTAIRSVNAVAKNLVSASQELEWEDAPEESGNRIEAGPTAELVLIDEATSARNGGGSVVTDLAVGGGLGLVLSVLLVLGTGIVRGTVLGRDQLDDLVRQTTSAGTPWNVR